MKKTPPPERRKGRTQPARKDRAATGVLPPREDVLEFLRGQPDASLRDAAKALGVRPGPDKIAFKKVFRELKDAPRAGAGEPGGLPPFTPVEVTGRDADGELLCSVIGATTPAGAIIVLAPGEGGAEGGLPALGVGEQFLAKLVKISDAEYEARVVRRLSAPRERVLGVYRAGPRLGRIESVDKKAKFEYVVAAADAMEAVDGELVEAELIRGRIAGLPQARIRARIGDLNAPKTVSLISIHAHGLSTVFPDAALRQAEVAGPVALDGRADLRQTPLLTIDPADARDHDDAVWAQYDDTANNAGGFHAIVAIADVAHYVTPGSALDREAKLRGNSTYFPDRVVPMLPERLSADLCSLKDGVDRPVIACHLTIDKHGEVTKYRFERAMMRSAASLSYERAQAAADGAGDAEAAALWEPVLKPLWDCYRAMVRARDARSPLDLDVPEHKIKLDAEGRVASIDKRERLDAHRLIEEFMIQANVAAASALEEARGPVVYRIHEPPSTEKLMALSEFLRTLSIKLNPHAVVKTPQLSGILARAAGTDNAELVSEIMLRSQSLAVYDPSNAGHFGLNLRRYAHFTSPIRRYADLLVHRSLIRHLDLGGGGGLTDGEAAKLKDIAQSISACERRSMAAEREANERYIAAFMSERVGATFTGKISGVTRFGLFLKLDGSGADGLIPMRSLGAERFHHDPKAHALTGERSKTTYKLGQRLEVKLVEAAPLTGGLRFELTGAAAPRSSGSRPGFRRANRRK